MITSKTHQTVVLPKTLTKQLKKLAKKQSHSLTKLVQIVLDQYVSDETQGKLFLKGITHGKRSDH